MNKNNKGYTLLEIMIVIGVIIAIMTITMRFSGSRIELLQQQTHKEEMRNQYNQIIINNMSSNYHNQQRYEEITITMTTDGAGFIYRTDNNPNEIGFSSPHIKISEIKGDNDTLEEVQILINPYKIGCKIKNNETTYKQTAIKQQINNKTYCFSIQENTCKRENHLCEE